MDKVRTGTAMGIAAGAFLLLALAPSASADAPAQSTITPSIAHPAPPAIQPSAGGDTEDSTPVLAPVPADAKKDADLGSVTCFACPSGADTFHGSICMNGIACAAEGVTLERLKIDQGKDNPAITVALRKLEAARVELKKPKGQSSRKALQLINTALTELKTAGLKTGCKSR
jgi:hypothetical protein